MAGVFGSIAQPLEDTADLPNVWHAASEGALQTVISVLAPNGQLNDLNVADENGYTPLMAASSYGHKEVCEWLLKNGADVNRQDVEGDTALHYCTNSAECMQLLISSGGQTAVKNSDGKSVIEKLKEELEEEQSAFAEDMLSGSTEELQKIARVVTFLETGTIPPFVQFEVSASEQPQIETINENPAIAGSSMDQS